MRRSLSPPLRIELLILLLSAGTCCTTPAFAHKVVVFATGAGKSIEGEVYFHGGAPARDVKVTLVGPEDQLLGETKTDQEGTFTFPIRFRCDYQVIADAGEGHGAQYTVPADELPDNLPPPGGDPGTSGKQAEGAELTTAPGPEEGPEGKAAPRAPDAPSLPAASGGEKARPESPQNPVAAFHTEDLQAEIQALGKQLAALRKDLNKYNNELRFRDILGGLGFILGIMGVTFYFLGVRRKETRSATRDP